MTKPPSPSQVRIALLKVDLAIKVTNKLQAGKTRNTSQAEAAMAAAVGKSKPLDCSPRKDVEEANSLACRL
jgi:hypothetical protein